MSREIQRFKNFKLKSKNSLIRITTTTAINRRTKKYSEAARSFLPIKNKIDIKMEKPRLQSKNNIGKYEKSSI